MNKDVYRDLLLRFAKELDDVGVTQEIIDLIKDQCERAPNVASCNAQKDVSRFIYSHDGYKIEAVKNIKLVVKKCL